MKYDCVLFDLDNTLLVRTPSIVEKVSQVLKQHAVNFKFDIIEALYAESELWTGKQIETENKSGIRMSDAEFFDHILSIYQNRLHFDENTRRSLLPVISGRYLKEYKLTAGTREIMNVLIAQDVSLGVVSNNYASIRKELEKLHITDCFKCIIISDEVGLSKPDPKILEMACDKIHVGREKCLYVGDHPFDVLCAHAASMDAAWFPQSKYFKIPEGIANPEYTIHSLQDLVSIVT